MYSTLLKDHEYLSESYTPDKYDLSSQERGVGIEIRRTNLYAVGIGTTADEEITRSDEAG